MLMGLKRKLEDYRELKVVRGVFDEYTLLTMYELLNKNKIHVQSLIKEGKESVILSGLMKGVEWVAIKVYRTKACDFKAMWRYLIGDPRFKNMKKKRHFVVHLWCRREFDNLKIAKTAGIDCPEPLFFKKNVLIMSFIGKNGIPAPRLIDIEPQNPERIYKTCLKNLERLVKVGLVHGDLSPYNILLFRKPYFIDFSHSTTLKSQIALELLKRDIKNLNAYFSKLNVPVKDSEVIYESLIELVE